MKLLKNIDRKTFKARFGTKDACLKHLEQVIWTNGYNYRRCSGTAFIKGKQFGSRRCKHCGYHESATSQALFHKVKYGIVKAFEMLYEIVASKKRG